MTASNNDGREAHEPDESFDPTTSTEIVFEGDDDLPLDIAEYIRESDEYDHIDEFANDALRTALEMENWEDFVEETAQQLAE